MPRPPVGLLQQSPIEIASARPLFGKDAPKWGVIRIALDNAVPISQQQALQGTFLWAVDASDLLATINVRFNAQSNDPIPFFVGQNINTRFGQVYLDWPAQPGKFIKLAFTASDNPMFITNPFRSLTQIQILGNTSTILKSAPDVVLVAAAAAVQVLAVNVGRRTAIIGNNSNVNSIRVGDSSISNTQGSLVGPGGSIALDTQAAIFAFSQVGATINIQEV